jgi:hypothetical protein
MAKRDAPADDIMKDALERFEESQEGSEWVREEYYEDTKFARMSDQWPDAIKKQRVQEGRPALVINKLPALIRAVVNESRQNKPAIKIGPVDNGADEDTAEVISGLIRSIERNSNAEVAYDTAIDHAVTGGMGFFRVGIDYSHDDTFDMEARIERIPNALMVHWDTSSTAFDASDWGYAFISDMMNERDYKAQYPDGSMVQFDGDSRNDASDQWISDDSIRVAEYFLRVEKMRKLMLIAVENPESGQTDVRSVRRDSIPTMAKEFLDAGGISSEGIGDDELISTFLELTGVEVKQERDAKYWEVMRRVVNGVEVLDEELWPGSSIPICPVWGDEVYIDGRRNFKSMIRDAKDPQAMLNYWRSASTELVALAPKAPFIGPKGFVPKGHESKWASANTRSHAFLEYDPSAGNAPQRQSFAGVPAGALQEAMNANDDMKAITGIFDSSLGARSNETSGKAILARERQGDVSNFHFIDNLSRAIRYCGQILVEVIPSVYSARETIRILGEDQAQNVMKLTQEGAQAYQKGVNGEKPLYNLGVGKYDVTVTTGPSFTTQREETRETLIEIMKQVPDAAAYLGDVLLDHMDFVGADKVSKRLAMLLPEQIRNAESEDNQDNPEASALKAKMQEMTQKVDGMKQQAMAEMKRLNDENEALKADKSMDGQKAQADAMAKKAELDLKSRELALKEAEFKLKAQHEMAEPEVTPQQQWEYDTLVEHERQAFVAAEAEKDRQVDLAKTIINKVEDGDTSETVESAAAVAMQQAAQLMAAPKEIVRDEFGEVIGVRTITS